VLGEPRLLHRGVAACLRGSRAEGFAPGVAHGLLIWFDTVLDGHWLLHAPGQPELIYGSAFFPWSAPVRLEPHQTVSVVLRADLVGGDYVWTWETRVNSGAGTSLPHFRQSTFLGSPLSQVQLRKRALARTGAIK